MLSKNCTNISSEQYMRVLISLIPVIGIFWYVYLAIQPSNSDSNF